MSALKRLSLFELEDQAWFPDWIRVLMTRYIVALHRLMGTGPVIAELAARALKATELRQIHDLCSGHGGPQRQVLTALREEHDLQDVRVTLSDLYPNAEAAAEFNGDGDAGITYRTESVDARSPGELGPGLRSLICSLHHIPPEGVKDILSDAARARQPFLAFEISDNSSPTLLWWTAIPFGFLLTFFVTPCVRPLTLKQLVFTYLIPLLPLCIAWDGAASNARTYTAGDLETLLAEVPSEDYRWETGTVGSGPTRKLYLLGLPEG